jgi:FtsP/CotA-like multicopper oxidase with cupredoxin domain
MRPFSLSRRRFVGYATLAGFSVGGGLRFVSGPALALDKQEPPKSGAFDLSVGPAPVNFTGHPALATAVNGSVPGPILRLREGEIATIHVTNRLDEPTSIHWHGIRLPNAMDGVPGLTFKGIMPGETFTYHFPVLQSGTYWYHSHSGMQEQTGLYGALIVEPLSKEPYSYDRDYVVMLSDWADENPMTVLSNLKQQSDYYNYAQRTLGTFIADAKRQGLSATLTDRLIWGKMRMSPTDIMDVTGAIYTFLINGQPPDANWTGLFEQGERIRLRFINGSSMSTFDVRIPGLAMTIVQADGTDIVPVVVDEFRIGVAETYDAIVTPAGAEAYTVFAQSQDRSGYARATLATRTGLEAPVPPMDPRALRGMVGMGRMGDRRAMAMDQMNDTDMSLPKKDNAGMSGMDTPKMPGMNMGSGGMAGMSMGNMSDADAAKMGPDMPQTSMAGNSMPVMKMPATPDGGMTQMPGMNQGPMAGMKMAEVPSSNADGVNPKTMLGQPSVDNIAADVREHFNEPGTGLDGKDRRILAYAQLAALHKGADAPPTRELQFHLTGNMNRWIWGFDGKKFSEAGPIDVKLGERIRFTLINDTMMEHPIHLHGFLFQVENGQSAMPYKHTINVKPGERVNVVFTADTAGYWAFHCHLLYHMEMGMFRTVVVA